MNFLKSLYEKLTAPMLEPQANPNMTYSRKPEAPGHWLSGWGFSAEQKAKADAWIKSFVNGTPI